MNALASYQVFIHKRAEKGLDDLPEHVVRRFATAFEMLEENPYRPRPGCDIRLVKGHPRLRAVRVGHYRGLDEVLVAERAFWFTKFGHRRSFYE